MLEHEVSLTGAHPFWTADLPLAEGRSGGERTAIRVRLHERWERDSHAVDREIVPLRAPRGQRRSFLAKPHLLRLDPILYVTPYPYPTPAGRGALGEVVGMATQGVHRRKIGSARARYYSAEATLVTWMALLPGRRLADAVQDPNLRAVWSGTRPCGWSPSWSTSRSTSASAGKHSFDTWATARWSQRRLSRSCSRARVLDCPLGSGCYNTKWGI